MAPRGCCGPVSFTLTCRGHEAVSIIKLKVNNDSLESGTRELLAKMVEAILDLMKQYPELGFRHRHGAVVAWRPEQGR